MTNTNIAAPNDPIARLWQIARAWLVDAMHAFGGPAEVARALSRFARHALARRLRALETLALKLLLVEAARLPPPSAACARARATATHVEKGSTAPAPSVDSSRPETWRVRFELRIPPEPVALGSESNSASRDRAPLAGDSVAEHEKQASLARMAPGALGASDPARERAKAEKLARRFEALRRVVADPLPRARRLKRKLRALKERAYDAAMRVAIRRPPHHELNPLVHARAEFAACCAVPALVATPDSS